MSKQARGIRVIRVICVDKTDRRGKRKEGRWRYREMEIQRDRERDRASGVHTERRAIERAVERERATIVVAYITYIAYVTYVSLSLFVFPTRPNRETARGKQWEMWPGRNCFRTSSHCFMPVPHLLPGYWLLVVAGRLVVGGWRKNAYTKILLLRAKSDENQPLLNTPSIKIFITL